MEHLSNDHRDHPNQLENSYKLCNETGHPILGKFPNGGKAIVDEILASEEINKSKRAGLSQSQLGT